MAPRRGRCHAAAGGARRARTGRARTGNAGWPAHQRLRRGDVRGGGHPAAAPRRHPTPDPGDVHDPAGRLPQPGRGLRAAAAARRPLRAGRAHRLAPGASGRQWPRLRRASRRGRGDFTTLIAVDIPAGGATEPQQHLYEETIHVLSGQGSTAIERPDGSRQSFEWGAHSVFAIPMNAKHQHFNGSGSKPVRMASTNSLPVMMKLFRNDDYIFGGSDFRPAFGEEKYFTGDGDFVRISPGRHLWETNFVPDLMRLELHEWSARGAGGSSVFLVMADSIMHSHISEMPVGTYKKAHRHDSDVYVWPLDEGGYTLLWYEGDEGFQRVDWRYGVAVGTPLMMYHQHFNTRPDRARYLATGMGGLRYPFTEQKTNTFRGVDVSIKDGGRQLEYEDEDPRIRELFQEECRAWGHESRMDELLGDG